MIITIITPFDSSNYGAFLQAYCLKLQLENDGHAVQHIYTRNAQYVRNLYYSDAPTRKKEWLHFWNFYKKKKFGIRKLELFRRDQCAFQVVQDTSNTDLFILGSDEIWNINQEVFRQDVFWGIGYQPAISYAASIGNASASVLLNEQKYVDAVRDLKDVLVRDAHTKEFVDSVLEKRNASLVCDPTMLIPVREYSEKFQDDYLIHNDCLLVYAYHVNKQQRTAINKYAKKHHMKTVSCCFWHEWCDHQCDCSPLQFSSLIRQCKAVFTTTFHGSIFSILNHANFVSVPTSIKTSQLLSQFGLEFRLLPENIFSEETLTVALDETKIDYDTVERTVKLVREQSVNELRRAIKLVSGGSYEV